MAPSNFLQSEHWRRFQEENDLRTVTLPGGFGVIHRLPLVGAYLYAPRWPDAEIMNQALGMMEGLQSVAHTHACGWIRVEPENEAALQSLEQIFGAGRVESAPHDVQPREHLIVDITKSEEQLLSEMKSKTRYNIRLAEKHGVTVRFSRAAADLEQFIDLIYATTERKAIRPHPKNYYRNFFAIFPETGSVLALAEHEGKVLAANLMVFFEGTAQYLHGGSSSEGRHLMAPYLLQWRSIEEAKRRGCQWYDFGGVSTQPSTINHQASKLKEWAGITRFKQGFAPSTPSRSFPGAYDIVISPSRYRLYRLLQRLQVLKKRLFY